MNHEEARVALLHLTADDPNISNATLKCSLDLLSYLDIEELEVDSIASDEWGAVTFTFAASELPQLAVHGSDVTAFRSSGDDPVTKLINAITCALEADELADQDGSDEDVGDE
ncbi:MAG TPA: hypothetical protein VG963_09215 [Polyangiaceae bacterium]|nr:hypothetical protein [Polyangiaceae bacterium]